MPTVALSIAGSDSGAGAGIQADLKTFVSELVPIATLITPNLMEAEKLAGVKIKSEGDAIEAARKIKKLGVENVIIKGGHSNTNKVTDILFHRKETVYRLSNTRIAVKESHGSGCNFSAGITALLARGFQLVDACKIANQYVHESIENALKLGKGLV